MAGSACRSAVKSQRAPNAGGGRCKRSGGRLRCGTIRTAEYSGAGRSGLSARSSPIPFRVIGRIGRDMTRAITFTQAQVRRAVKAAESAGLRVKRVTINADGSITVDAGDNAPIAVDSREAALAASWDDV